MTKDKKLEHEMKTDYPLIPMSEITDEARLLAVAWVDGYEPQGMDIPGKQKLASDIMNYARRHTSRPSLDIDKVVEQLREQCPHGANPTPHPEEGVYNVIWNECVDKLKELLNQKEGK